MKYLPKLPADAEVYHLLKVVRNMNNPEGVTTHVDLNNATYDHAEQWGMLLAEVAQIIVRDYQYTPEIHSDYGDAFAAIRNTFNKWMDHYERRRTEAEVKSDPSADKPTDQDPPAQDRSGS
jgi:hypothetical protein